MRYEHDNAREVTIKTTLGEILAKLTILDDSVTTNVGRNFSKKESVKELKNILQDIEVSIPRQSVNDMLKKIDKRYRNSFIGNMVKGEIEKFFERDQHRETY